MSARSERSSVPGSAFATPSAIFGDLSRGSTVSACGSAASSGKSPAEGTETKRKPPFRPAPDDTKPVLRDPISRSDPVETEQAVLRLPACRPSPDADSRLDDPMSRIVLTKSRR